MADNSLLDKASYIRSRIDTILRMVYVAMFPKVKNTNNISQAELIEKTLDKSKWPKLHARLDLARMILNAKAMHRFELENSTKGPQKELTENNYKHCLKTICDFIAVMSGIPIPPALLHACDKASPCPVKNYSRIEVIFLIQLFSDISQMGKGAFILSQLKKMIGERERIGLDSLNVKVVTYAPPMTLMDLPAVGEHSKASASCGSDVALTTALDLLETAITRTEDLGGDKPWLMWMAHDITDRLGEESVNRLQQMMDDKKIGFYPMALAPEAKEHFTKQWPDCGPKDLNPSLANNFFNSVLLTIQGMHAEQLSQHPIFSYPLLTTNQNPNNDTT